eukprot:6480094-Amphidinium_carterae.1
MSHDPEKRQVETPSWVTFHSCILITFSENSQRQPENKKTLRVVTTSSLFVCGHCVGLNKFLPFGPHPEPWQFAHPSEHLYPTTKRSKRQCCCHALEGHLATRQLQETRKQCMNQTMTIKDRKIVKNVPKWRVTICACFAKLGQRGLCWRHACT